MSRSAVLASLGLLAPLTLAACGPSMKNLVESDMRFEHCYRIDEDPSTPLDHKRSCWREWTTHYAKGQERSRVVYAKDRVKVLNGAIATPQPAVAAAPTVACPNPSDPYAPPPSTVPKDDKSAAAPGTATLCSDACTKAWRTCATPCGAESGCMLNCDSKFRECVKACL